MPPSQAPPSSTQHRPDEQARSTEKAAPLPAQPGVLRAYRNELARTSAQRWNRFWFTPADPATLGVIRALTGVMLVYTHWVWGLDFKSFFGPQSWVTSELVQRYLADAYVFSLWYVVPHQYAYAVHLICVGLLGLFALGLFTRVTSILALVIVISYANRVPTALFGLDQINGLLTFYLALGPSGAAYSLDAWLRRRAATRRTGDASLQHPIPNIEHRTSNIEHPTSNIQHPTSPARCAGDVNPPAPGFGFDAVAPSVHANLAIRLIQIHMCVIYLAAGFAKLQGLAWWDGMAMWLAFANQEYQTLDMLWLAQYPILINLLTHFTIFWEVTYSVFVWMPLLRPLVLFFAFVLHLGIGVCMGMWTFGLIMIIGNLAFVPPHLVRRVLTRRNRVKSFDR